MFQLVFVRSPQFATVEARQKATGELLETLAKNKIELNAVLTNYVEKWAMGPIPVPLDDGPGGPA
eukprot:6546696-Pyramimonas_sp.AAC.1